MIKGLKIKKIERKRGRVRNSRIYNLGMRIWQVIGGETVIG